VDVHAQLSPNGRRVLEGRVRDSLKAETGFAPLYLELDLAQRLMDAGYDVEFSDMERTGQYDLLFKREAFAGEVECKSLSADAGRQIHRKDFYRFIEEVSPALQKQLALEGREVLLVTLDGRLSPDRGSQVELLAAVNRALCGDGPDLIEAAELKLERMPYSSVLADASTDDKKAFYNACTQAFGPNTHAAGTLTEEGGCLIVMRSRREDDTSEPLLEAMRKAATQFSGERPPFIAVQEHDIEVADLMLPHVRRRAGILSYAL
jgi:hypothetical protein